MKPTAYYCVLFHPVEERLQHILIALLSELDYEGFEEQKNTLKAYIQIASYDVLKLETLLSTLSLTKDIQYKRSLLPQKNWNKEWEKHFSPIFIKNKCIVSASFHHILDDDAPYKIQIDPKMTFGTGHHATTYMMLDEICVYKADLLHASVLDMGCGTGILAILASMMKAKKVIAIDNDIWAVKNAIQNCIANKTQMVEVLLGGFDKIPHLKFNFIFANINKNILKKHIEILQHRLHEKGTLLISGILRSDMLEIQSEVEKQQLYIEKKSMKKEWIALTIRHKNYIL